MDSKQLENSNPKVYLKSKDRETTRADEDDRLVDEIDAREVFDLIRGIRDPEHPFTLEELNVVSEEHCEVDVKDNVCRVWFTPTIDHCSMATLIGLSIQVKLIRSLPEQFKIDVFIAPGSHATEEAVNKQLADKERVAAALENQHLLEVVNQCLLESF
ncbi:unnamed protein product [Medioppia subpectinata]|uniref:MIP18 family-like domain-containing protein n=1 Tax=Medioppia subpectinata TaxID=1979941 RepID=A0A7R9KFZ6_9ACAR|nr:unnamed protein product [Medioppia subpectinata]CAG2102639.1 unnamed protein product [Medioppia subpectinata]